MALKLIRMDAGTPECQILPHLQCFLITKDNVTHPGHNHHWQTPHQLNPMNSTSAIAKIMWLMSPPPMGWLSRLNLSTQE